MEKTCQMSFFFLFPAVEPHFSRVAAGILEDFPAAVPLHSSRGAEFRASEGRSQGRVGCVDSQLKGVVGDENRSS